MQLRYVFVIAPILAAVGISACGSSSKTTSAATAPAQTAAHPTTSIASPSAATALDPALVARADAVCARAKTRLDAHGPFPYQNFDALHPDVKLLPKIGAFFARSNRPPITSPSNCASSRAHTMHKRCGANYSRSPGSTA
jgi:hypothetical protein